MGNCPESFQLAWIILFGLAYTVAGVIVVRKYEEQSAVPCLVTNAAASMALYLSASFGYIYRSQVPQVTYL